MTAKRSVIKHCCASDCQASSRDEDARFFNFPRNAARAQLWAEQVGLPCSEDNSKELRRKHLCHRHFSSSDYRTAERIHLNRVAVPSLLGSISSPHSTVQHSGPSFCIPSSQTGLTPEDDLHVLPPLITYSKIPVTSTPIKEPIPVHMSTPEVNTFSNNEVSFPLNFENENACGGELESINPPSSSPKRRARHSLLKELDLARVAELTPKKRKLYNRIRKHESALCKLKKKYKAKKLKAICHLDSHPVVESLSDSLNVSGATLLVGMIKNCRKKPKGRRWSYKEKVLALSLLKRSPRSYIVLRQMFPLPSKRTLQSVLNTVQFRTGINAHVFSALKHSVQKMSAKDRLCCLLFDEMSIRENLRFSQAIGCIEGFEDHGRKGRTRSIANHALVFMVRGLRRKWKQPVAYYLIRGGTKALMLVDFLNEVLDACQKAGLTVVATVCDMGASNVKALKQLGVSEMKPFFEFGGQEIAAIFDPPHLLKCTRNMFLKHDVTNVGFEIDVNGSMLSCTASWQDILKLSEIDKLNVLYRQLPNVTDAHLNPVAQSAMKVSLAAQIMSASVAAGINTQVTAGHMENSCLATAKFVKDVDDLFDSFNGVTLYPERGKVLRCRLSDSSKHVAHWKEAANVVRNWTFLDKESKPFRTPPSQTGWLISLAAVQHVWERVRKVLPSLATRSLNQDPLENTFGAIRFHCGSNNNPTVGQFVDALKTVIINGLAFRGLNGTNCEDDGDTLLDTLQSFLNESDDSSPTPSTSHGTETTHIPDISHVTPGLQKEMEAAVQAGDMKMFSVAYVSGFIARRLLRGGNCDACNACLTSDVMSLTNIFISFKEYSDKEQSLTYPSERLVETVGTSVTILENMITEVAHSDSVEDCITNAIKEKVDFGWIQSTGCSLHYQGIVDGIVKGVTRISIPWWCKRRNRLMGEATRRRALERKLKILTHK